MVRSRARGLPLITKTGLRPTSVQDLGDDDDVEAQFIAPLLMLGARAAPLLARVAPAAGRLATRVGPKALKYGLKYGPDVIDALRNGDDIETQDNDDDDAEAQYLLTNQLLPLLLNNPFQEQAEAESFLGKLIEATSKHAPELLQYGLKYGPKILGNRDNGETQDDDDDANAQIRPGLYPVSGDLITDLASKLIRRVAKNIPRPSIQDDDDDDDTALVEALLQNLQDKADIQTLGMLWALGK